MNNLSSKEIFELIVGDFEGAWNSIAKNPDKIARCNFMLAKQAMILLEFAARIYSSGKGGGIKRNYSNIYETLSNNLSNIDVRYFTKLPSPCFRSREFVLPSIYSRKTTKDPILWLVFDLIRNGLAHQYQQILLKLKDRKSFFINLTGPEYGNTLEFTERPNADNHLAYFTNKGDIGLIVKPEILFQDFKKIILESQLLDQGQLLYLSRPMKRTTTKSKKLPRKVNYYDFDSNQLLMCLERGNHPKLP